MRNTDTYMHSQDQRQNLMNTNKKKKTERMIRNRMRNNDTYMHSQVLVQKQNLDFKCCTKPKGVSLQATNASTKHLEQIRCVSGSNN